MFTWLNKQGVRSDSGFEFQFTDRFEAEYRERGASTTMYVDGSADVVTIYEGSIENLWNRLVDPEARRKERDRVVSNIRAALAFQGLKLDLADGPEPDY